MANYDYEAIDLAGDPTTEDYPFSFFTVGDHPIGDDDETCTCHQIDLVPSCPLCGGQVSTVLGKLGGNTWFRCRECGIDHFHQPVEDGQ
jgi:hypothetical protein